jgi:hypothetical protein
LGGCEYPTNPCIDDYGIPGRMMCADVHYFSSGSGVSVDFSVFSPLIFAQTYYSASYISLCLTQDFLIFSTRIPSPSVYVNSSYDPRMSSDPNYDRYSVQYTSFHCTPDLIDVNRFGSYDPVISSFTSPFDGIFY